jgi:glucose-6-phosphate isomerase
MLEGAAIVRDQFYASPEVSPATYFAAVQVGLYDKGVGDVVFMPYIERLASTSEWFVQLWAESLGKRDESGECIGPTPVAALGARDQHSLLQLLMEGPISKNVVFLTEAVVDDSLYVPEPPPAASQLKHLGGHPLSDTVNAELRGVAAGLRESGRPTSEFILDKLNARSLGALLMGLEISTSLAGRMLRINPFDQPGVELGKRYAHGILGREKEAEYARRLERWLQETDFATADLLSEPSAPVIDDCGE